MKNKSKVIYEKTIWLSIVILFFLLMFIFEEIKTTATQGGTTSQEVQTVNNFNATISTPTLLFPNPNPTTANIGDTINVRYNFKATPSPMYTNINPSPIDEAMFLVDESINNNNRSQFQSDYIMHVIDNWIINKNNTKNIRMGFLGMNNQTDKLRGSNESAKYKDAGEDLSNVNLLNINNCNVADIAQQRVAMLSQKSSIQSPNVTDSLIQADHILQTEGQANKNKAIVLIISQNFTYDESKIKSLENRGYDIIIIDVSYDKQQNKNLAEENLKTLFDDFGGYGDNYIVGQHETTGESRAYNNPDKSDGEGYQINKSMMQGMNNKSYKLTNLKFNFDLGEGFLPVINSTTINYSTTVNNSPTIISVKGDNLQSEASLGNNRYSLTIPNIIFKCHIIKNLASDDPSKIKVKYTPQINGQDIADDGNVYVNFKVNFKQYTSDNPVVFGTRDTVNDINHNNFSYNDINQKIIDPVLINTTAVKGNTNISIIHGIYNGNKNGVQTIDDTNTNNTFAQGSVVTMAAKFEVTAQSQLQLNLVKNQTRTDQEQLTLIGTPKIYKIQSDGQLSQLGVMDSSNKYTVDESNLGKIIVIYSVKLPVYSTKLPNGTKISYTNTMKVGEASKDANIQIGNDGLPDLF